MADNSDIKLTAPAAEPEPNKLRDILSTLLTIAITCAVLLIINAIFHPVKVAGSSMYPTLTNGEWLQCTSARGKDIQAGDIVIFRETNGKPLVKRVVGVPGETLTVRDGYVYADGVRRDADSLPQMDDPGILTNGVTLKDDEYFCCGDNRNNSNDSRYIGPIKKNQIKLIVKSRLFGGAIEENKETK